ncbi:hypothetical protein [Variovorax paradoxus]|uniref:Uncharacterized protein n=1 Tax=Variovorax paradoxus TaxID=34073 RepID=A0A6I6HAT8_VARPD|nr:hypothetical protein [Variovorax paradoxus]QGW81936.1 hypothetical protein GOQ09_10180 [Variovorax paradoxus]
MKSPAALLAKLHRTLEETYALERETGFLRLDAMRSDATFWVAEQLASGASLDLLEASPDWLVDELYEWVTVFRRDGRFGFVSNLGEVDHSALFALVAAKLPAKRV